MASPYCTDAKEVLYYPINFGEQSARMSAVVIPISEALRLARVRPGPRVRMAARLWATGAVRSKKEAAEAVGLNPNYFTSMTIVNPEVSSMIGEIDSSINDQSVALSKVIALVARRAVKKMHELIDSGNEHIALKASSDILDRNPETSKTIKATVTSFSLDGQDAKEIAASLVEAAKVKELYSPLAAGNFIRVEEEPNGKEANDQVRSRDRSGGEDALPGSNGREEGRGTLPGAAARGDDEGTPGVHV